MRRRKKFLPFLIGAAISFVLLLVSIIFFSPTQNVGIEVLSAPAVLVFFILVFSFGFFVGTYVFANYIRGLLVASYITIVLFLRFMDFRNFIYPILLLVLLIIFDRLLTRHA